MDIEIMNDVVPLHKNSLVSEAQKMLDELTFSHLIIVDGSQFLGCIAEYDIRTLDADKLISDYADFYESFFVTEGVNSLEIMEATSKYDANIMPVLSQEEKKYLGYVELKYVMSAFSDMPFLSEYGNVIVVAKGINDHSFSEVTQIVESNNTKVLCAYISDTKKDMIQTTVKIGDGDFNAIIQTFRRYGYEIISDHYDDVFLNNLKERSRYFNKYLNI